MKIGWCSTAVEAAICYPPPQRLYIPKDSSASGRGYLSCPAVRSYFAGTYLIAAPYSLHLSASEQNGVLSIRPVFPGTSLTDSKVDEFVRIEPRSSWRAPGVVALQIPSPYLFFSDEPVLIRQESTQLTTPTSFSWRLIPGKFNIYEWQRPVNWAIEWHIAAGDLIIKAGEPLYFLSFETPEGASIEKMELVECQMGDALREQMLLTRGVTALRRGIMPLLPIAGEQRAGKTFVTPKVKPSDDQAERPAAHGETS